MRARMSMVSLVVAAALLLGAGAAGAWPGPGSGPAAGTAWHGGGFGGHRGALPARAGLLVCHGGVSGVGRVATFVGNMRAIPGAVRLQMRFNLLVRRPHERRETVLSAPGLGVWVSSDAGTARLRYRKRIENLGAPGRYRARVTFRWLDANGATIAWVTRRTRACRQYDLRPNLQVLQVGGWLLRGGTRARYTILVRNGGRSSSGPSTIALAVPGARPVTAGVPPLSAGGRTIVRLVGPSCPSGGALMATADVGRQIDERREDDNTLTVSCPRAVETPSPGGSPV